MCVRERGRRVLFVFGDEKKESVAKTASLFFILFYEASIACLSRLFFFFTSFPHVVARPRRREAAPARARRLLLDSLLRARVDRVLRATVRKAGRERDRKEENEHQTRPNRYACRRSSKNPSPDPFFDLFLSDLSLSLSPHTPFPSPYALPYLTRTHTGDEAPSPSSLPPRGRETASDTTPRR